MLTRLEIDGFKTFRRFSLELSPFLVMLGRNASGKSNVFDAIQLLRRLSSQPLVDAVEDTRGNIDELFHARNDGTSTNEFTIAVEVMLDLEVSDPYSERVPIRHNRIRYEVTIERRSNDRSLSRLYVKHESAFLIKKDDDSWLKRMQFPASFRRTRVRYSGRKSSVLLDTVVDDIGRSSFHIHQEGHAGRPRVLAAHAAEATALSSITTTEFPLLYALRNEMQSWRFLQLDPVALREPTSFQDELRPLSPSGHHLAAVLHRIRSSTSTDERPEGDLADLSADLARLVPGVRGVSVEEDASLRQWSVVVESFGEASYSARVASDGTLRLLALLAVLYDPHHQGLVCFEEPENGVYPQRLVKFVRYLRELVLVPYSFPDVTDPRPLGQLLSNSHSPLVLDALPRADVVYADLASFLDDGGRASRVTRARALVAGFQDALPLDLPPPMSELEIAAYHARSELQDSKW